MHWVKHDRVILLTILSITFHHCKTLLVIQESAVACIGRHITQVGLAHRCGGE